MACKNRLRTTLQNPKSHLPLALAFWGIHLLFVFITCNIYPLEWHRPVHSVLDDLIPFCEVFVVPYLLWFVMLLVTAVWFYRHDRQMFLRYHLFLVTLDLMIFTVYFVYPTMVPFQPTQFPRDNIFTDLVALIYDADRPTNACPSFHVAYSLAIGSAWSKRKETSPWLKAGIWAFVAIICMATVFIKQHSVLDFFWALPFCLVAECVAFGKHYWLPKFKK